MEKDSTWRARRSETGSDSEDLRADQRIGGMMKGAEDKSWAPRMCFNKCLSEDLLCARTRMEAEEETEG